MLQRALVAVHRYLPSGLRGYGRLGGDEGAPCAPGANSKADNVSSSSDNGNQHSAERQRNITSSSHYAITAPQGGASAGGDSHHPADNPHHRVPLFAYPLLVAAVFAVSSAATVFSLMPEVPAVTLAAWRLQLTSVFLGLGAAHQWRLMPPDDRSRALRSLGWLAGSGGCLAVHFGAWVWGLQHTSLTHSLLMVSATPLLLAGLALATGAPVSRGELGGTLLGLAGAVVLSVGATGGREARVGLAGDLSSLLASAVMVGYLSVGRRLRQWMPIFVYAFPVTGFAALVLTLLGGLVLEPVSLGGSGSRGVFGWLASNRYGPWVLYLALGPGIVGHTGFNTLLRYLSPLTVALAFQMEPLVGSVIGWAAGVMQPPGSLTYGGGALVVAATVWVTLARSETEAAAARRGSDGGGGGPGAGDAAGAGSGGKGAWLAMAARRWARLKGGDVEDGGVGGRAQEAEENVGLLSVSKT